MTGIGWTEFIVIALILLLFVGPQKLPELFSKIAYVMAQLKSASRDLRNQIDIEVEELNQVKSQITAEMLAHADEVYAEARQIDDEYKALQDDIKDVESKIESDLKAVSATMDDKSVDEKKHMKKPIRTAEKKEMKG